MAAAPRRRSAGRRPLPPRRRPRFTLAGSGTVVTGTVLAGSVAIGDRLMVPPFGPGSARPLPARPEPAAEQRPRGRALRPQPRWRRHRQGRGPARRHRARSRRCTHHRPHRCRAASLASEAKPLRQWMPVHFHHGAADVTARRRRCSSDPARSRRASCVQIVLRSADRGRCRRPLRPARHVGQPHHRRRRAARPWRAGAQAPHARAPRRARGAGRR